MVEDFESFVKKKLEELSKKIMIYISRRGYLVSSYEIAKYLHEVSMSDITPRVLIRDVAFGAKFFKSLRKYIPIHIDYVRKSVGLLYTRAPFPSVFARIIYQIYSRGQSRVYGPVRIMGITKFYVKKGLKNLSSLGKKLLAEKAVSLRYRREILRIARMHEKIGEITRKLKKEEVLSFIWRPLEDMRGLGGIGNLYALFFDTPKNVSLKLLAVLKYVDENPDILLEGEEYVE